MKDFGSVTDEMLNLIIGEKTQLPEHVFVSNFLPVFSGEFPIDKIPDFISMWVSVAGSPGTSVDIINSKKEILFTVPPLFDSSFIDPSRSSEKSMNIAEIISFAKMHNGISPALEKKVFIDNIQKKLDEMKKTSPMYATNIEKWLNIFKRYKVGPYKDKPVEDNKRSSTIVSNLSDDDFE